MKITRLIITVSDSVVVVIVVIKIDQEEDSNVEDTGKSSNRQPRLPNRNAKNGGQAKSHCTTVIEIRGSAKNEDQEKEKDKSKERGREGGRQAFAPSIYKSARVDNTGKLAESL